MNKLSTNSTNSQNSKIKKNSGDTILVSIHISLAFHPFEELKFWIICFLNV